MNIPRRDPIQKLPKIDPIRLQRYQGAASLIPLDYASRYEYSLVWVSREWVSLFHLLRAPQPFFTTIKGAFSSTPTATVSGVVQNIEWEVMGPITIRLHPLTDPSLKNLSVLATLGAKRVDLENAGGGDFAAYQTALDNLNLGQTGAYVAEFAVETRMLSIYYYPPKVVGSANFERSITPVTSSPLTPGSPITLHHFDIDFGHEHNMDEVSYARAQIAMDMMEDCSRVNGYFSRVNLQANLAAQAAGSSFYRGSGALTPLSQVPLPMTHPAASSAAPALAKRRPPTVTMESIEPDPSVPHKARPLKNTGGTDPQATSPPYPCIVLVTMEVNGQEVVVEVIIKSYSEENG